MVAIEFDDHTLREIAERGRGADTGGASTDAAACREASTARFDDGDIDRSEEAGSA